MLPRLVNFIALLIRLFTTCSSLTGSAVISTHPLRADPQSVLHLGFTFRRCMRAMSANILFSEKTETLNSMVFDSIFERSRISEIRNISNCPFFSINWHTRCPPALNRTATLQCGKPIGIQRSTDLVTHIGGKHSSTGRSAVPSGGIVQPVLYIFMLPYSCRYLQYGTADLTVAPHK